MPRIAGLMACALLLAGTAGDAIAAPTVNPAAAPTTLQELDQRLAGLFAKGHIPGASVAIIEHGQVTLAKGYGYADVARKIPATADTPFRAGSISKAITSIAVMTLVERKKLSLDSPVASLVPQIHFVNRWEKTDPVRLANVLEHTAGWPDIGPRVLDKDEPGWTNMQGVQFAAPGYVSRWKPGTFMSYDNAGPPVAAIAIEKASGEDFDAYARDAVLRPLGMTNADFDLTPALAARIARSYGADGSITPYQHIVLKPAGSLNASAREMAQLVRFYIGRGTVDGRRILTPDSVARIEQGRTNLGARFGFTGGYGLGDTPFPDKGITFHGHNGQIDSFSSVIGYSLRNGSGYVLMANGGEGVDFGQPAAELIEAYLTRGVVMHPPPTVRISQAELEKYAGIYRPITPPNALWIPYSVTLMLTEVKAGAGKLVQNGKDLLPVGPHIFRHADHEEASYAFVEDGGRVYRISAFDAKAKDPLWKVWAIWGVALSLVLETLVGLVMLIPWLIAQARGRLSSRGGLALRFVPMAGLAAVIINYTLPLLALASGDAKGIHELATVGPYSLAVLACSLIYPVCGAVDLVLAVRGRDAGWFSRAYSALTSATLLAVTGYAIAIGWFAMRTWTM